MTMHCKIVGRICSICPRKCKVMESEYDVLDYFGFADKTILCGWDSGVVIGNWRLLWLLRPFYWENSVGNGAGVSVVNLCQSISCVRLILAVGTNANAKEILYLQVRPSFEKRSPLHLPSLQPSPTNQPTTKLPTSNL